MPLAFIAKNDPEKLPGLVQRTERYLKRGVEPKLRAEMWTAIDLLMGLRYDRAFVRQLLKGVSAMEESVTYQDIIEKGVEKGKKQGYVDGQIDEARRILLQMGTRHLGRPSKSVLQKINSIQSRSALETMLAKALRSDNWQDVV